MRAFRSTARHAPLGRGRHDTNAPVGLTGRSGVRRAAVVLPETMATTRAASSWRSWVRAVNSAAYKSLARGAVPGWGSGFRCGRFCSTAGE
jgi:hypothetical protein